MIKLPLCRRREEKKGSFPAWPMPFLVSGEVRGFLLLCSDGLRDGLVGGRLGAKLLVDLGYGLRKGQEELAQGEEGRQAGKGGTPHRGNGVNDILQGTCELVLGLIPFKVREECSNAHCKRVESRAEVEIQEKRGGREWMCGCGTIVYGENVLMGFHLARFRIDVEIVELASDFVDHSLKKLVLAAQILAQQEERVERTDSKRRNVEAGGGAAHIRDYCL